MLWPRTVCDDRRYCISALVRNEHPGARCLEIDKLLSAELERGKVGHRKEDEKQGDPAMYVVQSQQVHGYSVAQPHDD